MILDILYDIIDFLLPFEWIKHDFMKNAFLAIILLAPVFGILGTMVVGNRMAFFSDSIGHGSFTGLAIGAILGGIRPIWSAILFSVAFAVVITVIKNKSRASIDTVIGAFSSTAVAVGLVILSLGGGIGKYSSYLVGDILSISPFEILLAFAALVAVVILWTVMFNKVLLISISQSLAASRGVKILPVEIILTATIATVVTISIQWVGLLIINSLLVLPAAASRNISGNVRQYHAISIGISMFSGISGLILSYYLNTATGATIVLIAAFLYFISILTGKRFSA
ncbi:MAG: metal ABC transporter permease [Acetivibrionales bacterium]|jgi:zinc transport system permease protein